MKRFDHLCLQIDHINAIMTSIHDTIETDHSIKTTTEIIKLVPNLIDLISMVEPFTKLLIGDKDTKNTSDTKNIGITRTDTPAPTTGSVTPPKDLINTLSELMNLITPNQTSDVSSTIITNTFNELMNIPAPAPAPESVPPTRTQTTVDSKNTNGTPC